MHAGADLQQYAHDRHFVAHRFEEQLLEQIARLEPVAFIEVTQRAGEAGIVFERRQRNPSSTTPQPADVTWPYALPSQISRRKS